MPTAIVTGASRGLGLALSRALAAEGWELAIDARGADPLERAARELGETTNVVALPGDITDSWHRAALIEAAGLNVDLLVNNAGALGPTPLPALIDYPLADLRRVFEANVLAPLAMAQLAIPRMPDGATILNVTSDAAVEAYPQWGGYGSSKAALEQISAVLGAEHPRLHVHAVDPGDMRTQMARDAFGGEDISDRPPPEESVPGLLALIARPRPSGRWRVSELQAVVAA